MGARWFCNDAQKKIFESNQSVVPAASCGAVSARQDFKSPGNFLCNLVRRGRGGAGITRLGPDEKAAGTQSVLGCHRLFVWFYDPVDIGNG